MTFAETQHTLLSSVRVKTGAGCKTFIIFYALFFGYILAKQVTLLPHFSSVYMLCVLMPNSNASILMNMAN